MNKQEYIDKYGEEAYENHKIKAREYHRIHGSNYIKKTEYIEKFGEDAWQEFLYKKREQYKSNPTSRRNAGAKWKEKNHAYNMKINKKTYQAFCVESEWPLIENYELAKADNFKGWDCHHRLELHPDYSVRFNKKSLQDLDLYYNRPANELIFLTHAEHARIHSIGRGINE